MVVAVTGARAVGGAVAGARHVAGDLAGVLRLPAADFAGPKYCCLQRLWEY